MITYDLDSQEAGTDVFTYAIADSGSLEVDATDGLDNLRTWVQSEPSLPSDVDHYMLLTRFLYILYSNWD